MSAATDEVHGFLGAATRELSRMGRPQSIVLLDDAGARRHLLELRRHADVILVAGHASRYVRYKAFYDACCEELVRSRPALLHFHGVASCVVGSVALRRCALRARVFYSPRGARAPGPVHEALLHVRRDEASAPLVLSGGAPAGIRAIDRLSQLAVLLSAAELNIAFEWLGAMDPRLAGCLEAAGIRRVALEAGSIPASELSRGWLYVAPWRPRGHPSFLVQTMAAGLPSVVLDCPRHRQIVEHGTTGFLCGSADEMVGAVALLIDDPVLRGRMGGAARDAARTRFGSLEFRARLLNSYAPHPA
ncbi:MAG TPA: glycosyltransferase [Variovorax sp.]|nr:glycosyltransferase [Variovorax sp.]